MAHAVHRLASLLVLLAVTSSAKDLSRWSRQISSYTSDISDWVPLSGPVERETLPPIKRQAVAEPRILSEPFPGLSRPSGFSSEVFPSRTYFNNAANRQQLYLQSVPSVPSAPQNYLTDQGFGHSIRFGLSQPNFPLNQAFVSPQFGYDSISQLPQIPQIKPKPQAPLNPVKFDTFSKTSQFQTSPVPVKTFNNQLQKVKPEPPKFVDGYRAENFSDFTFQKKKPQSLQKIKFENFDKPVARPEISHNNQKPNAKVEREEVQLLYVPLESLNRGQFNFRSPITSSQILNTDLYSQGAQSAKQPVQELQRPQKPAEPAIQNYFSDFNSQLNSQQLSQQQHSQIHGQQQKGLDQVPKFSTLTSPFPIGQPTTPKPKKLKPHQPPLAIFLTQEEARNQQIKVGDVLTSLKNANSVAVLDSVNPLNAPKVFIGPSSLTPPERYVKFELPYLSNIDSSDKKLRQLPFFVAPLSYNTPQGFAKIPFPSPHVGSVVINAQIKEASTQVPSTEIKPSYYTGNFRQEQKVERTTQKPTISFYSTSAPKANDHTNFQSNYYQFEPQTVSTIRPIKEPGTVAAPRPGNYFLSNTGNQYNQFDTSQLDPAQYELTPQNYHPLPEPVKTYPAIRQETTTTPRPTTTTTKPPSTYPSQLLETHNPYSINQAFHFSTPLDYHSYVDDYKEPASQVATETPTLPQRPSTSSAPKEEQVVTEKQRYSQQTSPIYQSYSPEIHYESEIRKPSYPSYNSNEYTTKTESAESYRPAQPSQPEYDIPVFKPSNDEFTPSNPVEYTSTQDTQVSVQSESPTEESNKPTVTEVENASKFDYNQYETAYESNEEHTSTTSSTTTTRRTPLRGRGRPRYTTTSKPESGEYTTRAVTRRPLRERRPLPTRSRYEPNKITTEKPTRKPEYSEEVTTKATRTRTRGRVTYKPSDESYDRKKSQNGKEQDLAYQRDVLHQNYPVTLMERASTVDIEAITEPTLRLSSTKDIEQATETYDTENAYTYERATISQHESNVDSNEDIPVYQTRTTVSQAETSYVPRLSTRNEDYVYHSRSSYAPTNSVPHEETQTENSVDTKPTTPIEKEVSEQVFATESTNSVNEQKEQSHTENEEYSFKEEDSTTTPEPEVTKSNSQETEEENVVQTTPSYNRVRVRPGVIKQYHQASTESNRIKADKRRPVTYRPAYDRRRTTMRIDEIQQDLKTKQVRGRPDNDEYRHPVYKPESTTEPTSTQEATTKRGPYRRRRPSYSYTTTTTEGAPNRKNTYEVKNRFRGRRPTTEKPIDKTDTQTEVPTTTARPLYSRYSHRPKLSERYNKKPETEETEDQDSNYSINRPKYTEPDFDKWSPKIQSDSFKPYNPNDILDEQKLATTERRSDRGELDIITARNEYEDILISVTPATNNRNNKKIPDIPPTLEALVEQSKVTKSDSSDNMSTFESMLEEVMKSLEEQDEDEYTSSVMKHKGGEIGEIPPERIISSGEYSTKSTTVLEEEATTVQPDALDDSPTKEEEPDQKSRRRGFWKKVKKVRPAATETIEAAESQYYPNTVNRLGQPLSASKLANDKSKYEKKVSVTTYKPTFQFIKDIFSSGDDMTSGNEEIMPAVEISKLNAYTDNKDNKTEDGPTTVANNEVHTDKTSPGDLDLGTGSPDPTIDDFYTTTEPTTIKAEKGPFSLMDYLFGTSEDSDAKEHLESSNTEHVEITTDAPKSKMPTTESSFIPDEMTESLDDVTEHIDIKKVNTELPKEVTTMEPPKVTESSFVKTANVVSTSMSTEVSHETEICFRGKCIKTYKNVL